MKRRPPRQAALCPLAYTAVLFAPAPALRHPTGKGQIGFSVKLKRPQVIGSDAAEYLDSEDMLAGYLTAAMEGKNPDVFLAALSDVAKARGITQLARDIEDGVEFWFARELAPVLKYSKWENFHRVVKRAMLACQNSGFDIGDHFPEVRKMVGIGKRKSV